MSVCTNCKNRLSCGCQKRTASDGKACCSNCLATYEASLKNNNSGSVKLTYKGPGQQIK